MKRHAAPIIAAILLLLPVLYVGSYLALVVPGGYAMRDPRREGVYDSWVYYRWLPPRSCAVFWPLEQIDRKVRPRAWGPEAKMRWISSQSR